MKIIRSIFLIWVGVITPSWGRDASPDVPLSHPVYEVVARFAARGWMDAPQTRPWSRQEVARLLYAMATHLSDVSSTEQGIFNRHCVEFAEELRALGYEVSEQRKFLQGGPLWSWRDSVALVVVMPLLRQGLVAPRGNALVRETVSQTYVGGIVEGHYAGLGFRVRHFEAREWTTGVRLKRGDVLAHPVEDVQLKNDAADFREGVFQLVWGNAWFAIDAGKGVVDWGPGRTGNLLLSNRGPSYGLYRLRISHGPVRYTHLAGALHARPGLIDTTRRWIDNGHVRIFLRQKRLAAHRLEVDLARGLTLGLHESVIYGDRGFEPLYTLPVTPFSAVQNHLDNKDNLAMGADVSFRPGGGFEAYGAWFFDDLMKFSPGAFSNKFALQLGVFWVDPLGLSDTDLNAEYVRIEPFVYSHDYHVNTYENYDVLLGHGIGPNADLWHVKVVHRVSPVLQVFAMFKKERQGENVVHVDGSIQNVGGNAELGRRPFDLPIRNFMSGDVESRTRLGAGFVLEPRINWALRAGYERVAGKNVLLPMGRGQAGGHVWTATMDVYFY